MDRKKLINFLLDFGMTILIVAFLAVCYWLFTSCSPRVVTVPEYHYEKMATTDTIILRDSVFSEKNTIIREADSAMIQELGIKLQQGERAILVLRKELEKAVNKQREVLRDTFVRCDSIRVPYPVEKPIPAWQKWTMRIGWIGIGLAAIWFQWWLVRWLVRRKERRES